MVHQSLIPYPNNCFSIFSHHLINFHKFQLINQQLSNQLFINLLFAGLQVQVSHLVIGGNRAPGLTLYPPGQGVSQIGVSLVRPLNSKKFEAISNTQKNHQIGLPRPSKVSKMRSKQVSEVIQISKKNRNVKPNENHCFSNVFERLGYQKSAVFPIKNHQESCLQSESTFWYLKSHETSKSDPKVSPMGDPKSFKNR